MIGDAGCSNGTRVGIVASIFTLLLLFAPNSFAGIDIRFTGTTPVLEKNILDFLSMSRYTGRSDLTQAVVERLGRRIPAEVRKALEPLGYYAASATYKITRQGNDWQVTIAVDPGRAVRIEKTDIAIDGPGADDPALRAIIRRGDLHPGARLDHGVYENVKAELLRVANNRGYFDARLTKHEMIIDPVARRAQVVLHMDSGVRYRFGHIDLQQPVLDDSFARRLLRMHEGDPYSLDAILESQYVFDDSQYFSGVEFDPGDPNHATHEVPLSVRAGKNKRNRYGASVGYGTDTNVRGKLTWDNRYVNSHGHRSQVQLIGSSILKELSGSYIIPVMDVALEKVEVDPSVKKEQLADLLSRRAELQVGLTEVLGDWQRVLFLRLSNESTEPRASVPASSSVPNKRTFLIIPGISFATLPPSLLRQDRRRYTVFAELTGSPQTLGSDATFLQLRLSGERVFDLSKHWQLRTRGQLGLTWSDDFDTLPASERFFAGGDNSIRGFGLNELSPVDPVTHLRVGGRYLVVGSVEFERDLPPLFGIHNLAAATFFDAGNAFDHFSDPIEYSVGVGIRYRLIGVASVGIDVAQPLSEPGRTPRVHLRLTTLF